MNVQMVVSVHVDADAVALQLGCDVDRVRTDLVAYFRSRMEDAPAVADLDLKVNVQEVAA